MPAAGRRPTAGHHGRAAAFRPFLSVGNCKTATYIESAWGRTTWRMRMALSKTLDRRTGSDDVAARAGPGAGLRVRPGVRTAGALAVAALLVVPAPAAASLQAVLVSGFTDAGFRADLSHMYITLLESGYQEENILVCYNLGQSLDLNGDRINDVDFPCRDSADVAAAFDTVAARVTGGDVIVFFATGHGGSTVRAGNGYPNSGIFTESWADTVWDIEVTGYFKDIDAAAGSPTRKICLVVTCRSGGFITKFDGKGDDLDDLKNISVATSVRYDQRATYYADGYPMTQWWTSALRGQDWDGNPVDADRNNDGSVSLREAFRYAGSRSKESDKTPQYFADGCLLDHFTALNGGQLPVPVVTINMTCCPPEPPYPWDPVGCGGLGINVNANLGKTGTIEMIARLANGGTAPSPAGQLHYFYRDPTLCLGFHDTGWQSAGTEPIPPLLPGDTLDMPPVAFAPPPANSFGETNWTLAARVDDPANPPGSGWLDDDFQVKMVNRWTIDGAPGEIHETHLYAVNPEPESAAVVLAVDATLYPAEWNVQIVPAPGDTLLFGPGEERVVTVTMEAVGTAHTIGTAGIVEYLLPKDNNGSCEESGCVDTTCGGYVRMVGGATISLVTGPTAVERAESAPPAARLAVLPSVFTGETRITFYLVERSAVNVTVYNAAGRRVRTVANAVFDPGEHAVSWNGLDDRGKIAGPAVYFVRAVTNRSARVRRVIRLE